MSANTYTGPGLLSAPGAGTIAVTFTLSGEGMRWSGEASPAEEDAVFPPWVREGRAVSLRLAGGGRSQARIGHISLDRHRPLSLRGIGPWPGWPRGTEAP